MKSWEHIPLDKFFGLECSDVIEDESETIICFGNSCSISILTDLENVTIVSSRNPYKNIQISQILGEVIMGCAISSQNDLDVIFKSGVKMTLAIDRLPFECYVFMINDQTYAV